MGVVAACARPRHWTYCEFIIGQQHILLLWFTTPASALLGPT